MRITRDQVETAMTALGLTPDLTRLITITPEHVIVETVDMVDGAPVIENGVAVTSQQITDIEEAS